MKKTIINAFTFCIIFCSLSKLRAEEEVLCKDNPTHCDELIHELKNQAQYDKQNLETCERMQKRYKEWLKRAEDRLNAE